MILLEEARTLALLVQTNKPKSHVDAAAKLAEFVLSIPVATSHRSIQVHRLKTHLESFAAVWTGTKRYEIRINDRDYRVNDVLELCEYDSNTGEYSRERRFVLAYVTHITFGGAWGLPKVMCVMSLGSPQCGWSHAQAE